MNMEHTPGVGEGERKDEGKKGRSFAEIMSALGSNPNVRRQLQEKMVLAKKQREKQKPEGEAPTQH